ncbi:MAG: carboxymuconolactone decarboxylase family protein [Acidobacteria bacterium]|nr:carboxymuconolactone decarboxylase family protein [Acidobacteriota bacterium]
MADNAREFVAQWKSASGKMQRMMPETARGFGGLFGATMKEGALPVKQKELIAFSVGLALRCEPCIILHVQKCLEAGATRQEILEAAGVVVMMQGGPGYTHIPIVIEALEALEEVESLTPE